MGSHRLAVTRPPRLAPTALPELVRRRAEADLAAYCPTRLPPAVSAEVRLESEFRGNTATLLEVRPPWKSGTPPLPWTRSPIAQFRHDFATGRWSLYWPDRNGRWHIDDGTEPGDLEALLAAVDRDPTGIYWG